MRMKVVYIAGRYRDPRGEWYVEANRREAARAALTVWMNGGVALCPHMNTGGFGGAFGMPDDVWLNGDKELLRRCDAVYAIPGWDTSAGAIAEVALARELGLPILHNQADVFKYLEGDDAKDKA